MLAKRAFDLFVTVTAAISWIPALLVSALAILVCEGRPVFYVSRRVVAPGKTVRVVKFRTMVRNAEQVFNRSTVPIQRDGVRFLNLPPGSPLYTRVGRLVERCAFTEIPQLFLVLRGHMSLVGNRPLPESVTESLRDAYPDVDERLRTPAGMTGPVQLIGRERLTDGQRLDLERTYCRVASHAFTWRLDFLILLYTVLEAVRLRGPMTFGEVKEFLLSFAPPAPAREAQAGPSPAREVQSLPLIIADADEMEGAIAPVGVGAEAGGRHVESSARN